MELKQRNKKIRDLHSKGYSFAEIARSQNISPERVRQICLQTKDRNVLVNEMLSKYKTFLIVESGYEMILNEIAVLSKPNRNKEIVLRRNALIKYLHDKLNVSFYKIGLLLKKHHTSIMHGYYE